MLNIMKEKEMIVTKIFKDTEEKLEKIFKDEFKEFDIVTIKCHEDHDELKLEKDTKQVKLRLTTERYNAKIKDENKMNKGLYFRKCGKCENEFTEKEYKKIQERLQALYER